MDDKTINSLSKYKIKMLYFAGLVFLIVNTLNKLTWLKRDI